MMRRVIGLSLAAILVPGVASAQAWLSDRAAAEGAGVKVGNLEVHPGVGSEVGYDSNWFLRSSSTDARVLNGQGNALPVVGIPIVRVTPSLSLSNLTRDRMGAGGDPPKVTFRLSGAAVHRQYLASEWNNQSNTAGSVDLGVAIAPGKPVTATLGAGFSRAVNATASGDPNLMFGRNDALASGEVGWSPGGGTLEFRAGYRGRFTFFDNNDALKNNEHTGTARARWLFRPRNALFVDSSYGVMTYAKNTSDTRNLSPLRVRIGTSGLLTPRIGVLVAGGYGSAGLAADAKDVTPRFGGFVGQGELRYFFDASALPGESAEGNSSNALAVGAIRDFQSSFLGSYTTLSRAYARAAYLWQGRVYASLEGGVSSIDFNQLQFTSGTLQGQARTKAGFSNRRTDFQVFGEYRFSNALGLNATLRYTANSSDEVLKQDQSERYVDLNWTRFEAFAGVRYAL